MHAHAGATAVSRQIFVRGLVWTHAARWLSAAAVPVAAIAVLLAIDTRWSGSGPPAAIRTRFTAEMWLAEAALLVIWAPLLGVVTAMRAWSSPDAPADRTRSVRLVVGAIQLGRPLLARVALMTAISAAIAVAMRTTIDADMLRSHATLGMAALTFAALGAACARMFREPLDAAACAIGIALVAAFALFAAGPVLDSTPRWLLRAVLVINPVVATAAAASIDILRMDMLYQLSPLAHRHVDYPVLTTTLAVYVLFAAGLLGLSARQFTNR